MGTGIWAMHFIGMLAYYLPVLIAYNLPIVIVSWLAAVIAVSPSTACIEVLYTGSHC
jgi:NO-binding membrane sensor protein with MHYT domain